jgi:hypothetical protein
MKHRHAHLDLPKLFAAETLALVSSDDAFNTAVICDCAAAPLSRIHLRLREEAVLFGGGCTSARHAMHESWFLGDPRRRGWRLPEEFS